MNLKYLISCISCLFFSSHVILAQMPKWILGSAQQNSSGTFYTPATNHLEFYEIDFTGATPVFTQRVTGGTINSITSIGTNEVINSITDTSGNILFYVFANSTIAFNGSGTANAMDELYFAAYDPSTGADEIFGSLAPVTGGASSIRETGIVRKPGAIDEFYVIYTICSGNNKSYDALKYVEVNMATRTVSAPVTLASGYMNEGQVISKLDCSTGSRWLFFTRPNSVNMDLYKAQITNAGVSTPVLVTTIYVPGNISYGQGEIEISPTSDKLAVVNLTSNSVNQDIIIFDFNIATGTLSNQRWVNNPANRILSVEFSPDGQQLYAMKAGSAGYINELYHFPVPASNYTITASDLLMTNLTDAFSIEAAVDGKVYFNYDSYNNYLYYINNPNSANPTISTTPAFSFGNGNVTGHGFPDQIDGEDYTSLYPQSIAVANISASASSICAGQAVVLTGSGGTGYFWSGGSNSTSQTITVNPMVTTTYYLNVINGTCMSLPDTFVLQVQPVPVVSATTDTSICAGQSVTLTASGGASYQWSGDSSAVTSSITVSPMSNATYYVTANSGGCQSLPDTVSVQVMQYPLVSIIGNDSICQGQSIMLAASGGSSYQWSGGSTDTTQVITVSPGVTTTYVVTAANGNCYSQPDSITVNVVPFSASMSGPPAVCSGSTTTLYAAGGGNYLWSTGDTLSMITVNPTVTTTYSVIVTSASGCIDTALYTLNVNPSPFVNAGVDVTICIGDSIQLNGSFSGSTFYWTPNSNISSVYQVDPWVSPTTTTTYIMNALSQLDCSGSDSVTVFVSPCTGIDEIEAYGIEVAPNPSSGYFEIIMEHPLNNAVISLHNTVGQVLMTSREDLGLRTLVDVSGLAKGLYLVKVSAPGTVKIARIIIE